MVDAIVRPALEPLGWDPDWEAAFAPFAAEGVRPARVVAVHRETAIVRDGAAEGDRSASVSGSFRFEALARSDFPAVGDWVVLGADDVVSAILPRRSVFKRMAADSSRRGSSLDDEQIMASNIDVALLVAGSRQRLQPAPHRALPRDRDVEPDHAGRRPQQGRPGR